MIKAEHGFQEIIQRIFGHTAIYFTKKDKLVWLQYVIVLFLFWIPVLLAYYPGLFAYDVESQISQYTSKTFTTHHPLVHTLILGFCYELGGYIYSHNLGILLYTVFQILITACSISWLLLYLYRCRINIIIRTAFLIFFGVMPFISVMVISATKDIFFTCCYIIMCVCLCYFTEDEKTIKLNKFGWLYIISGIGMCMFRNNGIYFMGIFTIIYLIINKNRQSKLLFFSIIIICSSILFSKGLEIMCEAEKGSSNEIFSVPYQQLSRVAIYNNEELTEEEMTKITQIVPGWEGYNEFLADPVKGGGQIEKYGDIFIEIYLKYLTRYPKDYIVAFFQNNRGYWDIFDISHSQIYGTDNRQGYLLTDTKEGYNVYHKTYFPLLERCYEYLFTSNHYQDIPIIKFLFCPAVYSWILVLLNIMVYKQKREKERFVPFLFIYSFIFTILLGPCCLIRYALPYICCIPALFVVTFKR